MSAFLRIAPFLLACLTLIPLPCAAWDRGKVERFATLPAGALNPEGITVDRHNGDVYVTGFNPTGAGTGRIYVFDDDGSLKRVVDVPGSSSALLGLAFHPTTHELLVIDIGRGNVLRVNPHNGASSLFTHAPGASGLNALTFDRAGNVYISDSFQGTIWRTGPAGAVTAEPWKVDPLLTTTGFPPFGANGLDFNKDESALFVANTGNDTVVRIAKEGTIAGDATVFTHSINGADGLFLDRHDNVWVCANQSDEIVVTDKTGKAIAKLGDFNGLRGGSPVGLLFPASLVRHGDWIYITNLSLDLRPITGQQSVDSHWAAQVKTHTISRLRARIPGHDHDD